MTLYFKHITRIDDFPLNGYPACSLYDLNNAQLDMRVSVLDDEDGMGENASRHFNLKWHNTYHVIIMQQMWNDRGGDNT